MKTTCSSCGLTYDRSEHFHTFEECNRKPYKYRKLGFIGMYTSNDIIPRDFSYGSKVVINNHESHTLDSLRYALYKDLVEGDWMYSENDLQISPKFTFKDLTYIQDKLATKTRNQLNLNKMNNLTTEQKQKIERTNCVAQQISDLKTKIEKVRISHGLCRPGLEFLFGPEDFQVDPKYVNFKSLQAQVLAAMKKELKDLEKEFESI